MPRLTMNLLGGFEARLAPEGPPLALPRKTQALIAYLALAPRPVSRVELASLLWGDTGRQQAQQSLRQTLSVLRQSLEHAADVLVADPQAVSLDRANALADVHTFEALLKKGDAGALAEAAALYRGDLLAGFDLDEGPFEEWLLAQRERLRELAMNGLTRLLAQQSGAGALDDAVLTANRVLALDPLHEPAHRSLMKLYMAQGRRPAALRQYQTCLAVLRRELGVEPSAETQEAYTGALRAAAAPPKAAQPQRSAAPARSGGPPMVGRAAELERVRRAMREALEGSGALVAISGEAGVGKTRMLRQVAADALERGARVMVGRAYRSEQILPLGPWRDALREGAAAEDGEALLDAADPARVFSEVAKLLQGIAAAQPLVLLLEDLHWADDMTLRLLAYLGRRLAGRKLLIVTTAREEELADARALRATLADLERELPVTSLSLDPLSREATAALVRSLARGRGEALLHELSQRVWSASEGNALMAVEFLRAIEDGAVSAAADDAPLPERVRHVISGRLETLSEPARALLGIAAVIGRNFDFTLVARAAQLDEAASAAAVEELVRRRIFRFVGERFEFAHDRIREIVYGGLLPPRRKLCHRQTAQAMRALHGAALEPHYATLGAHAFEAESWEEAADCYRRAGEWAMARSFNREAAASFERAVAAVERLPGTAATAIDLRLQLHAVLVLLGDVERAEAPLERARRLAESLDDRARLGRVMAQVSSQRWWTGRHAEVLAPAETAARLAAETGDAELETAATLCRAYAHFSLGDYRQVPVLLDPLLERLGARERDRYGQHQLPIVSPSNQVTAALAHLGEFGTALGRSAENLARAEALDHRYGLTHTCWSLGEIHLHRRRGAEAIAPLERALALFPDRVDFFLYSNVLGSLGYAHVLDGRVDEGVRMMQEAFAGREQHPLRVGLSRFMARLGESLLVAGRTGEARSLAERCLALTRYQGERGYEAWAERLLGEIGLASGDAAGVEAAQARFAAALALAEPRGMQPVVAHCHAGLERWYRGRGEADPARRHGEAAAELYRRMGMAA